MKSIHPLLLGTFLSIPKWSVLQSWEGQAGSAGWADRPSTSCWPLTAGAQYLGEAGQDLPGAGTGELTDLLQAADRSLLKRSTLEKQVKTYQTQEQVSWLPATGCWPLTAGAKYLGEAGQDLPDAGTGELTDLLQAADLSLLERSTLEKQVKTYLSQEQVSWLTCYRLLTPHCWCEVRKKFRR